MALPHVTIPSSGDRYVWITSGVSRTTGQATRMGDSIGSSVTAEYKDVTGRFKVDTIEAAVMATRDMVTRREWAMDMKVYIVDKSDT